MQECPESQYGTAREEEQGMIGKHNVPTRTVKKEQTKGNWPTRFVKASGNVPGMRQVEREWQSLFKSGNLGSFHMRE